MNPHQFSLLSPGMQLHWVLHHGTYLAQRWLRTNLPRQHGLTCAPVSQGRRVGTHFAPGPEQQAVIQQFQVSALLVSGLASAVRHPPAHPPARLFDESSGRVPMLEERESALVQLLNKNASA